MFQLHHRSTRAAARTLVLLIVAGLMAASCGGDSEETAETTTTTRPSTTTEATTTTTEPPPVSRLTGLPLDDESILERPVVAVKIASDRAAQPQVGLNRADIVIEELVEGGISRFLAIFQTHDSDPVGPIRSARTSEVELLPLYGRPIFANSGANAGTVRILNDANTGVMAGHNSAYGSLYFRDRSRRGPNNLFTNITQLREVASESAAPPGEQFVFRAEGDEPPAQAMPTFGVDMSFGSTRVRWVWDGDAGRFLRWQDGREHLDPDDAQLGATNVVVLVTPYGTSPADPGSPEAITVGSGDAWVLTNGWVISGTWERPTRESRYVLRDGDGNEIPLTPGNTWIELPRAGNLSFLDADPR